VLFILGAGFGDKRVSRYYSQREPMLRLQLKGFLMSTSECFVTSCCRCVLKLIMSSKCGFLSFLNDISGLLLTINLICKMHAFNSKLAVLSTPERSCFNSVVSVLKSLARISGC